MTNGSSTTGLSSTSDTSKQGRSTSGSSTSGAFFLVTGVSNGRGAYIYVAGPPQPTATNAVLVEALVIKPVLTAMGIHPIHI